jgi:hypothetical protein
VRCRAQANARYLGLGERDYDSRSKYFNLLTIGGKLANTAQVKLKKNRLRYNQEVIRCGPDP